VEVHTRCAPISQSRTRSLDRQTRIGLDELPAKGRQNGGALVEDDTAASLKRYGAVVGDGSQRRIYVRAERGVLRWESCRVALGRARNECSGRVSKGVAAGLVGAARLEPLAECDARGGGLPVERCLAPSRMLCCASKRHADEGADEQHQQPVQDS
jgi:hypothetical protein